MTKAQFHRVMLNEIRLRKRGMKRKKANKPALILIVDED